MVVGEIGILRLELPDLALSAPLPEGVPSVSQVGPRDPIEPASPVEVRGDLEGERLVVDEAVVARRTNGLLVELHRIGVTSLDARDLGGYQGSAVAEILGTCPGTRIEPLAMCGECCEMRLAFAGGLGITG